MISRYTIVLLVAASGSPALAAEGSKVGDTQMCIDTTAIRQTPVIDSRTILVEMRGGSRGYKRIDLLSSCPGLDRQSGFGFSTSINRLCVPDGVHALESGAVCMIDKIVTIDEREAKELLAKKR